MTLRPRVSPLAIVLPHPALPAKSRPNTVSTEPHTPRSRHSSLNVQSIYYPANRKSSDSWNSSNADDHQEIEADWKHDEVLLLSRTLDALPSHLLTPFNGPIPPSNLLDKIARGVSQAKGPVDWPHSIRSTRAKLLQLARGRANDERDRSIAALVIQEGDEMSLDDVPHPNVLGVMKKKKNLNASCISKSKQPRAPLPLYRQSSMDFINPGPVDDVGNKAIARLSNRLQTPGRFKAYQQHQHYHPYTRPTTSRTPLRTLAHSTTRPTSTSTSSSTSRSSSPPITSDVPSLITSNSPYSTLTSSSSSSMRTLESALGSGSLRVLTDCDFDSDVEMKGVIPFHHHHQQATTRSVVRIGLKRAPEYGAVRQEVKVSKDRERVVVGGEENNNNKHSRNVSASYPSSDEEEKVRSVRVKKMRVGSAAAADVFGVGGTTAALPAATAPRRVPVKEKRRDENEDVSLARERVKTDPSPEGVKSPTTKRRAKADTTTNTTSPRSSPRSSKVTDGKEIQKVGPLSTGSPKVSKTTTTEAKIKKAKKPLPMNLQRNPSMFGEELPPLAGSLSLPASLPLPLMGGGGGVVEPFSSSSIGVAVVAPPVPPKDIKSPKRGVKKAKSTSPPPPISVLTSSVPTVASPTPTDISPSKSTSPTLPDGSSPVVRTLRRVKVRRLVPSRRISFGSIVPPEAEAEAAEVDAGAESGWCGGGHGGLAAASVDGLGSAIQLA